MLAWLSILYRKLQADCNRPNQKKQLDDDPKATQQINFMGYLEYEIITLVLEEVKENILGFVSTLG